MLQPCLNCYALFRNVLSRPRSFLISYWSFSILLVWTISAPVRAGDETPTKPGVLATSDLPAVGSDLKKTTESATPSTGLPNKSEALIPVSIPLERFFPEKTDVLFMDEGFDAHRDAFERTAAYDSLSSTGLLLFGQKLLEIYIQLTTSQTLNADELALLNEVKRSLQNLSSKGFAVGLGLAETKSRSQFQLTVILPFSGRLAALTAKEMQRPKTAATAPKAADKSVSPTGANAPHVADEPIKAPEILSEDAESPPAAATAEVKPTVEFNLVWKTETIGSRTIYRGKWTASESASAPPAADPAKADQSQLTSPELAFWDERGHFVLVYGTEAVQATLAVLDGRAANLAKHRIWKELHSESLRFERRSLGWIDMRGLRAAYDDTSIGTIETFVGGLENSIELFGEAIEELPDLLVSPFTTFTAVEAAPQAQFLPMPPDAIPAAVAPDVGVVPAPIPAAVKPGTVVGLQPIGPGQEVKAVPPVAAAQPPMGIMLVPAEGKKEKMIAVAKDKPQNVKQGPAKNDVIKPEAAKVGAATGPIHAGSDKKAVAAAPVIHINGKPVAASKTKPEKDTPGLEELGKAHLAGEKSVVQNDPKARQIAPAPAPAKTPEPVPVPADVAIAAPEAIPPERLVTLKKLLNALGLDSVDHYSWQGGYQGRALWSETKLTAAGPRQGLLGFTDQPPIQLDQLPPLPAASIGFFATSCDMKRISESFEQLSLGMKQLLTPEQWGELEQERKKWQDENGPVFENLTHSLDSLVCVYNDEVNGPLTIGPVLVWKIKNATRLRRVMNKFAVLANTQSESTSVPVIRKVSNQADAEEEEEENQPKVERIESVPATVPAFRVTRKTRYGREVVGIQAKDSPIGIAYVVEGDWLAVSFNSQLLDAFLLRIDKKLPRWQPTADHLAAFDQLPRQFTTLSVEDPRRSLMHLTSLGYCGLGFLESVQSADTPSQVKQMFADISNLPPAELILQPLFPNVSVTVSDPTGVRTYSRSSLPSFSWWTYAGSYFMLTQMEDLLNW